jgi:hypothetical protein
MKYVTFFPGGPERRMRGAQRRLQQCYKRSAAA